MAVLTFGGCGPVRLTLLRCFRCNPSDVVSQSIFKEVREAVGVNVTVTIRLDPYLVLGEPGRCLDIDMIVLK